MGESSPWITPRRTPGRTGEPCTSERVGDLARDEQREVGREARALARHAVSEGGEGPSLHEFLDGIRLRGPDQAEVLHPDDTRVSDTGRPLRRRSQRPEDFVVLVAGDDVEDLHGDRARHPEGPLVHPAIHRGHASLGRPGTRCGWSALADRDVGTRRRNQRRRASHVDFLRIGGDRASVVATIEPPAPAPGTARGASHSTRLAPSRPALVDPVGSTDGDPARVCAGGCRC